MSPQSLSTRFDPSVVVEELLGTPYKDGGRSVEGGFDCYGLFLYIMAEMGVDLPDWEYTVDWVESGEQLFLENYDKYADQVEPQDARPGDAILFKGKRGVLSHIAVYLGEARFLHVTETHGVHVGCMSRQPYDRLFEAFYRVKAAA